MKLQEHSQDELFIDADGIKPTGDSPFDQLLRGPLSSIRSFDNRC